MNQNQDEPGQKRHCMVVHAHYPLGETRVERQARTLIEAGHEVDVICLRSKKETAFEKIDNVNVFRLPVRRHKKRGALVQLLEYLAFCLLVFFRLTISYRQRRYRIIQVHNLPDFLIFAALIPKLAGIPIIIDLHDLMPEFYAARFDKEGSSWPVRLIAWQEKLSCLFASHVITVTQLWRETLIQRGVPANKISVVMNVADDRIFQHNTLPLPSSQEKDRFKLIYHGNLSQRYGIDLVIQAIEQVRAEIPQIKFIIHGAGEYQDELVRQVNESQLQHDISFSTHFMPSTELPHFIRSADIGVVPYRSDVFTDGILPTKLMEYAALGMPVITAHTSAIAAYFDDTMVQFFTPGDPDELAQCILTLYTNQQYLERLSRGIKVFNQRYNWTKLGAEYVALVEELAASKRK